MEQNSYYKKQMYGSTPNVLSKKATIYATDNFVGSGSSGKTEIIQPYEAILMLGFSYNLLCKNGVERKWWDNMSYTDFRISPVNYLDL